jgi:hypothetical protein
VLRVNVLGTRDLFAASLGKIIRSFDFEVFSVPDFVTVQPEPATNWWTKVLEASLSRHPSPGAGDDLRVDANALRAVLEQCFDSFLMFSRREAEEF